MAKLYFHYSAMNAGKTTLLLQTAHNYEERSLSPLLLKPGLDQREGSQLIQSRLGVSKPCLTFENDTDLCNLVSAHNSEENIDVVLVDEAQFISKEQVWQLGRVVDDLNIPVLCYGIRTDFRGELFIGSMYLLALADVLREIRTIDETGKNATMVLRLDENGKVIKDGPQNFVGGNESYKSVSRKEWRKAMEM